jgi:hypothetical protein
MEAKNIIRIIIWTVIILLLLLINRKVTSNKDNKILKIFSQKNTEQRIQDNLVHANRKDISNQKTQIPTKKKDISLNDRVYVVQFDNYFHLETCATTNLNRSHSLNLDEALIEGFAVCPSCLTDYELPHFDVKNYVVYIADIGSFYHRRTCKTVENFRVSKTLNRELLKDYKPHKHSGCAPPEM